MTVRDLYKLMSTDLSFEGRKYLTQPYYQTPKTNHTCLSNSTIFIEPHEICDGIPQCPNSTDESLDQCRGNFPASATHECFKPKIGNGMKVPILAHKCNGVVECEDGSYEKDCSLDTVTIVCGILTPGLVLCLSAAVLVIYMVKPQQTPAELDAMYQITSPREAKKKIIALQNSKARRVHNKFYFRYHLNQANGNKGEAINNIRDQVGPGVTNNLMSDIDNSKSCTKSMKKFFYGLIERIPVKTLSVILITKSLFSHFGDIAKDVFLVITIGQLVQGGDFFLQWVI